MAQRNRLFSISILIAAIALSCAACTRAELVDKADAYGAAIWDSSNKQILLNAVRASQRAPMSFVGYGDVQATPNVSGAAAGTFNFSPAGLTNYALNPSVNYSGGFSQFTMNNLNFSEFSKKMREPVKEELVQYFHHLNWPQEMVDLIFLHSVTISRAGYVSLIDSARAKCSADASERTQEICAQLNEDAATRAECAAHEIETAEATLTILNTARERCSMNKFQYVLRLHRLLSTKRIPGRPRTPEGMLYFLGELIAAQNYSADPYEPTTFIASGGRRHLVPLFVVRRGVSANAAVQIFLRGEGFFIPQPQLGSADEERSLQVLDLVSQAIVMATSKEALPKSNTVSLIAVR